MALVLTHNAPDSLDRCLRAISTPDHPAPGGPGPRQRRAARPSATEDTAPDSLPNVQLVRSDVNGGPRRWLCADPRGSS